MKTFQMHLKLHAFEDYHAI